MKLNGLDLSDLISREAPHLRNMLTSPLVILSEVIIILKHIIRI
jgi:hypothetical protein